MAERYAGGVASLTLAVGTKTAVDHSEATGRTGVSVTLPMRYRHRGEIGGIDVATALGFRGGTVSWMVDRTEETDKQLIPAQHRTGTVTIRVAGTGSGKPQLVVKGVITRSLTLTPQGSRYSVTLTKSGAATATTQS